MLISAYRIVKAEWAASAFDGAGARRNGGRWNSVGTPMVYTAENRSLAALEVPVRLEGPAHGFSLVRCEFPSSLVEICALDALPADWRSSPAPFSLAAVGDAWARRGTSVALAVPSTLVADERNYLLNPLHPGFARVTIHPPERFPYDERLVALAEGRRR